MKRQLEFSASAVLLASVLLGLAPPAGSQTAAPPGGQKSHEAGTGPARGNRAPDFTLESLTGEAVGLSNFRGKIMFLEFWATWCGPCKMMMPWLVDLQNQYGPQGLQIVGVSLDEDATKVEIGEFADQMHVNYPILIGDGKVDKAYGGVPAMPESFLIGRDGEIVERIIGLKSKGELEKAVKKALNLQSRPSRAGEAVGLASQPQK